MDTGTPTWEAIEITPEGCRIFQPIDPPFRRYSHQQALPEPDFSGDPLETFSDFFGLLPITGEGESDIERAEDEHDTQILLIIWLILACLEHIPRPILMFLWRARSSQKQRCTRISRTSRP